MERLGTLEEAHRVYVQIVELNQGLTLSDMKNRVGQKGMVLVSEVEGDLVGFKLGYPLSANCFYSWLGGVVPDARHRGIAQRLLDMQEKQVVQRGYREISVKSTEQYHAMHQLLLRNGYLITGAENTGAEVCRKIQFYKQLTRCEQSIL